jgi:hypothetical protein
MDHTFDLPPTRGLEPSPDDAYLLAMVDSLTEALDEARVAMNALARAFAAKLPASRGLQFVPLEVNHRFVADRAGSCPPRWRPR